MNLKSTALLALLTLPACLENEEEITVREDGSVRVRVAARGQMLDLAAGYAVPLHAPWIPSADGAEWIQRFGAATGGPEVAETVRSYAASLSEEDRKRERRVEAEADFASVADLPERFAPAGEPYADAYLGRATSLRIEQRGHRTVYMFERRYEPREAGPHALFDRMGDELREQHPEIHARFEEQTPLTAEQWQSVDEFVRATVAAAAGAGARDATSGIYTQGDAALSVEGHERAIAAVEQAVREVIYPGRVQGLMRDEERDAGTDSVDDLEAQVRDVGRRALETALESEGVRVEVRNAVMERLEFALTSADHTSDLEGETFRLIVNLPGTVVSGNWQEASNGRAVFSFEGERLKDGYVVLRAVSVAE